MRKPCHADQVISVIGTNTPALSALAASWRRSASLHGLDPAEHGTPRILTAQEFQAARQPLEPLIAAAQESLDRLYAAVGGAGCCVLLANTDGVPLERRGAVSDENTFRRWGLWTGADWSERHEGTNGIGTCIAEGRQVAVDRDQHFHSRNIGLSCMAAPIFDHEGRLAAALDVSSCRADLTSGFAQLISIAVADAAHRIEAGNFRSSFAHDRVLLLGAPDRAGSALVAVDADELVVGATRSARAMFGITSARLREGLPVADLIGGETHGEFEKAQRGAVQRALARSHGNVSAAAQALGVSRATLHRKLKRLGCGRLH